MDFGALDKMQISRAVERVLHVPGNYAGGILEMAFVFDMSLSKEKAESVGGKIGGILKSHSKVFQNVRLNVIRWYSDSDIRKEISALPLMQTGRYFEDYNQQSCSKNLELLAGQLKIFYARSKVVILITDESYGIGNKKSLIENLQPFLYRRLIIISCNETTSRDETGAIHPVIRTGLELLLTKG